jgi:hypothetical protein
VDDISGWMRSNRLQLNLDKTEFMWCTTGRRQQHRLIGSTSVLPVSSVRDLGIYIDSDLVMRTHVCKTVSSCFAALRQLRSIRRLVSTSVFQSLVTVLALSRLDYGHGTLVGLPAHSLVYQHTRWSTITLVGLPSHLVGLPSHLVGLPSHSLVYHHISLVYHHTRWSTITLVGLPAHLSFAVCSRFRMRRRDSFSGFAAPTTFLTLLLACIGYVCRSGLSSRLPS